MADEKRSGSVVGGSGYRSQNGARSVEMTPRVSIGLPVLNGGRYLSEAIESVLAQSFTDFELLVSDNGSTDDTPEIAARYAARDARVRLIRHDETHGARWNFNTVFEAGSGELFAWLAHDDVWAPYFLERCVAALDFDPRRVLAFSHVTYIDENSEPIGARDMTMRVASNKPHVRLWDLLMAWHDCLPIFGVIRSDALRKTSLIGPYSSGDHVLLAQLGLIGLFEIVDERLFHSRIHPGQSIQTYDVWVDHHAYADWFEAKDPGTFNFPQWQVLRDLLLAVTHAPISPLAKVLCLPALGRWSIRYRTLLWKDARIGARTWRVERANRSASPPRQRAS